jgi:iron(II)-dependent oxidoreductase
MRLAGPDLLSLALMDSRNALLQRLALDESAPALRLAAHAGWHQEYWIALPRAAPAGRSLRRQPRRAWRASERVDRWLLQGDDAAALDATETLRAYLSETLEITLDLLAGTPAADAPLHYFSAKPAARRPAGRSAGRALARRAAHTVARRVREPIWLPAQRWPLGTRRSPAAWCRTTSAGADEPWRARIRDRRAGRELGAVPGVCRGRWLRPRRALDRPGWAWVQDQGRRAPRGVEQMRGAVLLLAWQCQWRHCSAPR